LPYGFLDGSINRLFQLSDSSTTKRYFYLESGLNSILRYGLTGAGWGKAYWYYEGIGLVPSGNIPWYHNDYLNLAVQVGIPGLVLYLGFWFSFIKSIVSKQLSSSTNSFVVSGVAALIAVLVGASLEHLLWRSDMAGYVFWIAGFIIAASKLATVPKPKIGRRI